MFDVKKLKILKYVGYSLLVILAVIIGVGIGQGSSSKSIKTKTTNENSSTKNVLSQKKVKDFLLNYYTKKDLGENRPRYKDFMTDALYQQTVAIENEPQNQTYKGFVVDYKFKDAQIYINNDNHQVIAQVNYVNTQLDEKKNYETAQKDVVNKTTLRLSYVDENGKFKINKIESIILTDSAGTYGILDNSLKPLTSQLPDESNDTSQAQNN
ncbi:TPA: hypothetical protein VCU16_001372 [Streptococcus pyogenes]|uniref:hypothetical protein n=1 Tax=Streptococcus dysgalactiae TaxID=1334 RepID=UPI002B1C3906|nr:hypothetical protein [Streptococcus pyogenes]HEP4643530.1 hypothetical protein [Streptococcus pyogenes]HEP4646811.1 hypothetical protein [Streptococcus pyogenes]HEP4648611.1 hypothetical protein [Streptococcus pyogenes]HEP4650358.1 hypothetical protein [Streptococcus pyogenes]